MCAAAPLPNNNKQRHRRSRQRSSAPTSRTVRNIATVQAHKRSRAPSVQNNRQQCHYQKDINHQRRRPPKVNKHQHRRPSQWTAIATERKKRSTQQQRRPKSTRDPTASKISPEAAHKPSVWTAPPSPGRVPRTPSARASARVVSTWSRCAAAAGGGRAERASRRAPRSSATLKCKKLIRRFNGVHNFFFLFFFFFFFFFWWCF
jgi:hypothetical protein